IYRNLAKFWTNSSSGEQENPKVDTAMKGILPFPAVPPAGQSDAAVPAELPEPLTTVAGPEDQRTREKGISPTNPLSTALKKGPAVVSHPMSPSCHSTNSLRPFSAPKATPESMQGTRYSCYYTA
ncbi:hypothetical protein HGM15179_014119, partial [Zosterops borbonicus]